MLARKVPTWRTIPLYLPDYAAFTRYFSSQICDIFIAPLRDNLFNQMQEPDQIPGILGNRHAGRRTVELLPYEDVINGQNGFLAATPEEWEHALNRLIARSGAAQPHGLRGARDCQYSTGCCRITRRMGAGVSQHSLQWQRHGAEIGRFAGRAQGANLARRE